MSNVAVITIFMLKIFVVLNQMTLLRIHVHVWRSEVNKHNFSIRDLVTFLIIVAIIVVASLSDKFFDKDKKDQDND